MRATHLVQAVGTEFALPAYACHPFDSDSITLLPKVFHILGYGYDRACTLMPSYALGCLTHRNTNRFPFIVYEGLIRAADTAVVDPAKDMTGFELGDVNGGDFASWLASLLDSSFLFRWNAHGNCHLSL